MLSKISPKKYGLTCGMRCNCKSSEANGVEGISGLKGPQCTQPLPLERDVTLPMSSTLVHRNLQPTFLTIVPLNINVDLTALSCLVFHSPW